MGKTLIGTATTDSNGVASVSYVGEGAGILNIQAETSDGTLCSLPLEIYDCYFYDGGVTGNSNLSKWINTSSITTEVGSNGTTITNSSSSNKYFYADYLDNSSQYDFTPSFVIEFDIVSFTGTSSNQLLRLYNGTNANKSLSALGITGDNHIRVEVTANTVQYYVDGVSVGSAISHSGAAFDCGFIVNNGSITFRNFKIYAI